MVCSLLGGAACSNFSINPDALKRAGYFQTLGSLSLRVLTLIAALAIAGHSMAADLTTRFGRVTTIDSDQSGRSHVTFEGQSVTTIEADSVSLYRVSVASGGVEYVIVEKWLPGLNCHNEYLVLSIKEDRSFNLTPTFGECMKLEGASFAKGVASIKLRSPPSLPGKTRFETYVVENGTARKK